MVFGDFGLAERFRKGPVEKSEWPITTQKTCGRGINYSFHPRTWTFRMHFESTVARRRLEANEAEQGSVARRRFVSGLVSKDRERDRVEESGRDLFFRERGRGLRSAWSSS